MAGSHAGGVAPVVLSCVVYSSSVRAASRGRWRAPDLVKRKFAADGINRRWYGDGTEIATGEGRLYLDSVTGMGSRRILGHALGAHHDAALAYGALAMAVAGRARRRATR